MRDANGNKIPSKKVADRKAVKNFVSHLASQLPEMYEDHKCSMPKTGAEILADAELCAIYSEEHLATLEPDQVYQVPYTRTVRIDHYKRMLKIGDKHGVKAMQQYIEDTLAAGLERPMESIGGIQPQIDYGNFLQNF